VITLALVEAGTSEEGDPAQPASKKPKKMVTNRLMSHVPPMITTSLSITLEIDTTFHLLSLRLSENY